MWLYNAKEFNSDQALVVAVHSSGVYSVGLGNERPQYDTLPDKRFSNLRPHLTCSAASLLSQWSMDYDRCVDREDELAYTITVWEDPVDGLPFKPLLCINPRDVQGNAEAEEHIRVFVDTFAYLTKEI